MEKRDTPSPNWGRKKRANWFFRPVGNPREASPQERERAQQLLSEFGDSSYGHFQTTPDKSFFFSASGRSFVAYRVVYHVALALADPVGPAEETREAAGAFVTYARNNGWTAACRSASSRFPAGSNRCITAGRSSVSARTRMGIQ